MSVELDSNGAKWLLVLLVVLGGVLGGIAAELAKTRKIGGVDEEGGWEIPAKVSDRYKDWGGRASVLLGIVAAGIAMGLFDQIETITKPAEGNKPATTVEQYDLWRVVAVTLIAGFSAPKFLALAQERLLAMLTQKQAEGALLTTNKAAEVHAAQGASGASSPQAAMEQAQVIQAMTATVLPGVEPQIPGQDPPPAPAR